MNNEKLRLGALLGDGMVLQRNADVRIYGTARALQPICLRFLKREYRTSADSDGKWSMTIHTPETGGPYEMEIAGGEAVVLRDILVGDVYICAGQSNMQLPFERVSGEYPDDAQYQNEFIRQFLVPERYDFEAPQETLDGGAWVPASPQTLPDFTAAGFYFAKALYERYSVPIGLINIAVGGSKAEGWMSRESLAAFPEIAKDADMFSDKQYVEALVQREDQREKDWYANLDAQDIGLKSLPFYAEDCDDSGWAVMKLPAYWANAGLSAINGSIWFRRELILPQEAAESPAELLLGRIVDADFAYINGVLVGSTGYQYPPRQYSVPAGLLKAGKNSIAVRVISNCKKGGFVREKPYTLSVAGQAYDLTGEWKYKIGAAVEPLQERTFFFSRPVGLYNSMLAPLFNYSVLGVLFYQGESNTFYPENYEALFTAMIKLWRQKWKKADLPFFYVQLPNYLERENPLAIHKWAALREAQRKVLLQPATAMAVTIDLGEWNDLHPTNKKDVGLRLSLLARRELYGEKDIVACGPMYSGMKVEGNRVTLTFTETGSGLAAKGSDLLNNFELCGKEGLFCKADAYIENNEVIVFSDQIDKPVSVRYAFCDNPDNINFYNQEGLPACPFIASTSDK